MRKKVKAPRNRYLTEFRKEVRKLMYELSRYQRAEGEQWDAMTTHEYNKAQGEMQDSYTDMMITLDEIVRLASALGSDCGKLEWNMVHRIITKEI